jgi:hypothetical protein
MGEAARQSIHDRVKRISPDDVGQSNSVQCSSRSRGTDSDRQSASASEGTTADKAAVNSPGLRDTDLRHTLRHRTGGQDEESADVEDMAVRRDRGERGEGNGEGKRGRKEDLCRTHETQKSGAVEETDGPPGKHAHPEDLRNTLDLRKRKAGDQAQPEGQTDAEAVRHTCDNKATRSKEREERRVAEAAGDEKDLRHVLERRRRGEEGVHGSEGRRHRDDATLHHGNKEGCITNDRGERRDRGDRGDREGHGVRGGRGDREDRDLDRPPGRRGREGGEGAPERRGRGIGERYERPPPRGDCPPGHGGNSGSRRGERGASDTERPSKRQRGNADVPPEVVAAGDTAALPLASNAARKEAAPGRGGVYIPPFRLKQMLAEAAQDRASEQFQRMMWEALRKSLNGVVNKVNAGNIKAILPELFKENLVRGQGLLCQSIMKAQAASISFTPVFAALVAVVNTKFPEIGLLLCARVLQQFKVAYRRSDKPMCITSLEFVAHLVNQHVLNELVALEACPFAALCAPHPLPPMFLGDVSSLPQLPVEQTCSLGTANGAKVRLIPQADWPRALHSRLHLCHVMHMTMSLHAGARDAA